MNNEIMLSITCQTYNHAKYIRQSLDSFLLQETQYSYEIIIHDDASTDGTADIIREYRNKYPNVIRPVFQTENQYNKVNINEKYIFPLVRGKYVIIIDGDDYWIDNHKIEKQVAFMENHPECVLSLHNGIKKNEITGEEVLANTFPNNCTFGEYENLLLGIGTDFALTSSMMFRGNLLKEIPHFFFEVKGDDYTIRQYYGTRGKICYSSDVMSVYRTSTPGGFMESVKTDNEFYANYTLEMIRFFANYDKYTNYRHHELIEKKILSDYIGYCVSTDKVFGLARASRYEIIDKTLLIKCYDAVYSEKMSYELIDFCNNTDRLFLYGTSRLASIMLKKMANSGIKVEGFAVSNNREKMEMFEGYPVFFLNEVDHNIGEIGFVLCVQPINVMGIEQSLIESGYNRWFYPFDIIGGNL